MKCCDECGQPFMICDDGVAHHIDDDEEIDLDTDLSHVPYSTDSLDIDE